MRLTTAQFSITFARWSGIAAAVGGAVFLISMVTPLRGPLRVGLPAGVAWMALGTVGPYLVLRGRQRRLELLGLLLAGIGLVLGLVRMASSALGAWTPTRGLVINTGEHVGPVFIVAGMLTW
ncbi:hypothetical protein ACIBK9_49955 [Nonomuraea sp. NPDC050227]|uniref:hypothetical protein n=1 Tax=Nonomuraea sp. NPDC050227 TaxID=3364360 RepID=UPI00378E66D4